MSIDMDHSRRSHLQTKQLSVGTQYGRLLHNSRLLDSYFLFKMTEFRPQEAIEFSQEVILQL